MITKEKLISELAGLRQQQAETRAQLNAIGGAIQAIEQLIVHCDKAAAPAADGFATPPASSLQPPAS